MRGIIVMLGQHFLDACLKDKFDLNTTFQHQNERYFQRCPTYVFNASVNCGFYSQPSKYYCCCSPF